MVFKFRKYEYYLYFLKIYNLQFNYRTSIILFIDKAGIPLRNVDTIML